MFNLAVFHHEKPRFLEVEHSMHRKRINTEEKAKVVAAVWGTELIRFLAMHASYFALG